MRKLSILSFFTSSALLTALVVSQAIQSNAIAPRNEQLQSSITVEQDSQSTTKKENKKQKPKYTGIVQKIDDIAKEITVRIDTPNGNGSGVIIAHQGNTYYVLTAKHVLCSGESKTECISNGENQIVTPDGKAYTIYPQTVKTPADWLDVAVVEFKSDAAYQVATLANYELKEQWIFTSGFPDLKDGSKPQCILTGGKVRHSEETDFVVKEAFSLQEGRELVYTNISYAGMSGGAILDSQGRVIGINTASEQDTELTEQGVGILNIGYSLGIPIKDFIGLADKAATKLEWLKVVQSPASEIKDNDIATIKQQLLIVEKPSFDNNYVSWVNYGNQLWRSGNDINEVVEAFDKAISLQENPQAYYGIGLAYFDAKQYEKAAINFEQATVKGVQPYYWRWLGYSYNLSRNYTEALSAYNEAIKKEPNNLVFLIEKGDILTGLNRYTEAINSFDEALNIKSHPWAYNNRGVAYSGLEQYEKAIADYERALEINPQNTSAYNNRGSTYNQLEQYEQALADYDRALTIDPQNAQAYSNRGTIYNKLQQHEKALADFNQALAIAPQNSSAYNNRGSNYADLKQYDLAFADFDRAVEIDPQNAQAYFNRATTYAELQQYEKAIGDLNKAIALNPQDADYYYNRGFVYSNIGATQKAIADFTQAVTINPQFGEAYSNRGLMYADLGEIEKALTDYSKAIAVNPNLTDTYFNRGLVYFSLQQYDKAIADYNQTIEANPQDIDAYLNRGNVYAVEKQYDKALADYEQVLQINPDYFFALNNIGSVAYEQQDVNKAIDYWQQTKNRKSSRSRRTSFIN